MTSALVAAGSAALVVGLLGALLAAAVSSRSLRSGVLLAPLVAVAAMAAGILTGSRLMLFDAGRSRHLLWLVLVSLLVSVLVGAVLAWRAGALERARDAERTRRELIGHLSHDLRTPLAGIRAMSQALADGVGEQRDQYPARMLAQIDRAISMSDDMMTITTLGARPAEVRSQPVDVADVLSGAVEGQQARAERAGVAIEAGAMPPSGSLLGPAVPREIERAAVNLLANAIEHTPRGGTIVVSARSEAGGKRVRVGVRDQCGGISEDTAARMFDALWRADQARSPESAGSGLGLTIVRAIARAHGGEAEVLRHDDGCEVAFTVAR